MNWKIRENFGYLFTLIVLVILTACSENGTHAPQVDQETQLKAQLDTANRLMFAGQLQQALAKLEHLHQEYPQHNEVIEALGFAYVKQKDFALAGFYFDQVLMNDPSRTDIALYSGKAHFQAENWLFAANAYNIFLQDNPNDFVAWKALAEANDKLGKIKPTLDAYLNAFSNLNSTPNAQEAARMGTLFLRLGNATQATEWFEHAIEFTPPQPEYQIHGLLGLLEITWLTKDWNRAHTLIAELDAVAPQALDNSPLAYTREAIEKFKDAQAHLKQQSRFKTADTKAKTEPEASPPVSDPQNIAAVQTTSQHEDTPAPATTTTAVSRGTDNTAPESFHKYPPLPPTSETNLAPNNHAIEQDLATSSDPLIDGRIIIDRLTENEPPEPEPDPVSRLETAKTFQQAGDYPMAISQFQAYLADHPTSSEACYELSKTYFLTHSWSAAELYASEAMRLAPDNVAYTINYLKTVQKNQNQERLLKELVRAKENFPRSHDITLALAQAYERIVNNPRNASMLYEEYLDLAPLSHPKREAAENALQQLSMR